MARRFLSTNARQTGSTESGNRDGSQAGAHRLPTPFDSAALRRECLRQDGRGDSAAQGSQVESSSKGVGLRSCSTLNTAPVEMCSLGDEPETWNPYPTQEMPSRDSTDGCQTDIVEPYRTSYFAVEFHGRAPNHPHIDHFRVCGNGESLFHSRPIGRPGYRDGSDI